MRKLVIVAGPSGIGKTYLADQLILNYPSHFEQVKLFTTRPARKNDSLTDRILINESVFAKKLKKGDFIIAEEFHGNWYGYDKKSLLPDDKHLIVNAWPALLKKFQDTPNTLVIGLTTPISNIKILQQRMLKRGDPVEKIEGRIALIKRDLADFATLQDLISENGKVFTIQDDQTIPEIVIPWLRQTLLYKT